MNRLTLALLPVGPICVAALRYLLPYYTATSNTATARAVIAHPDRESAVVFLTVAAMLTLLPGLLAVANALPRTQLRAWALGLLVPGYLCLGALLAEDSTLWSAAHAHLGVRATAALLAATHPAINVATGIFVVGHVLGTTLFGVAVMRSRAVPSWAGWLVAVSQPLHFIAFVVFGSPLLDLVGWTLLAVGLAGVGRVLAGKPVPSSAPALTSAPAVLGQPLTLTLPAQYRVVHQSPPESKNPVNVDLQQDHRTTAVVHEPQMSGSIATRSATKRS